MSETIQPRVRVGDWVTPKPMRVTKVWRDGSLSCAPAVTTTVVVGLIANDIASVSPRPFAVGDRVTYKERFWRIVALDDETELGPRAAFIRTGSTTIDAAFLSDLRHADEASS